MRRSYLEGVKLGFLTQDPSQLHNPNVCAPYTNTTASKTTASNTTSSNTTSTNSANLQRAHRWPINLLYILYVFMFLHFFETLFIIPWGVAL